MAFFQGGPSITIIHPINLHHVRPPSLFIPFYSSLSTFSLQPPLVLNKNEKKKTPTTIINSYLSPSKVSPSNSHLPNFHPFLHSTHYSVHTQTYTYTVSFSRGILPNMEIPELNIISDFAPAINSLQNPSLFSSQIVSISAPPKFPQHFHTFWKWGALILTLIATFRAIITRINLLILRFVTDKLLSAKPKHSPTQHHLSYDSDSNDDDDDGSCSSASSDESEEQEPTTWLFQQPIDGDTRPWVCNSQGLGLDYEEGNSGSVVAMWDVNEGQRLNSFSPAVILSFGVNHKGNVLLTGYDRRVGDGVTAVCAEWRPRRQRERVVGFNYGEKVYVVDGVTGGALMVGDMRNVKTPLWEDDACWNAGDVNFLDYCDE